MLPRTGHTLIGPFGLSPGIVPTPASEPSCSCPATERSATAQATATATAHLMTPMNTANPLYPRAARIAGPLPYRRGLGWRRQRFQLFTILGIHRVRTAASRFIGNAVVPAEFVEGQIGRD